MDPAIITEVTSAGALAISIVNLIVARWDKHSEELKHPDSIAALRDLEQELSVWVNQSAETNGVVSDYLSGDASWDRVRNMVYHQGVTTGRIGRIIVDGPIFETWSSVQERRRSRTAQFLRIYAPELSDAFQVAAKRRYDLLGEILGREQFFEDKGDAYELFHALVESSTDLSSALGKLRRFMRDKIESLHHYRCCSLQYKSNKRRAVAQH